MAEKDSRTVNPPLIAEGLTRSYATRRQGIVSALQGFSLRLEPGDGLGLLGSNGSGKTTAIHLLLGLERPDAGWVRIFGRDPLHREAKRRLGYLPEETALFPFLSAEETLGLAARLHRMERTVRKRRIDEVLTVLGLDQVRRRKVATFSKGMARRLAFGRAVLHSPALLILDEPTSGLDPEGAATVFEILRQVRAAGTAVLFSTHLLREAEEQCTRLTLLSRGRRVRSGTLEELLGEEEERMSVSGLDVGDRDQLAAWVQDHGGRTEPTDVRRRSLERLFHSLLEEEEDRP